MGACPLAAVKTDGGAVSHLIPYGDLLDAGGSAWVPVRLIHVNAGPSQAIANIHRGRWRKTMAWTLVEQIYLFGAVAVFLTFAAMIAFAELQSRP